MTGSLGMQDSSAESAFHMFTAACYLFPLVGAWIADNYFGKYPVILYLSLVYCTGEAPNFHSLQNFPAQLVLLPFSFISAVVISTM